MARLSELGQVLHEEHFHILMAICELENRVSGAAGERVFDAEDKEDTGLLETFLGSLDQILAHHAFEERVVFPLLRAQGEVELTALLIGEHGAIEPKARRLRELAMTLLAQARAGGPCPVADWIAFRTAARDLVSEMMRHLEKEELVVVQRLPQFLDASTDHLLAARQVARRATSAVRGNAAAATADGISVRVAARDASVAQVNGAARAAARRRAMLPPALRP